MKCVKKTGGHECCSVFDIFLDSDGYEVPQWVRGLFEYGVLRIEYPNSGGSPALLMRSGLGLDKPTFEVVPSDGYIIRNDAGEVTGMSAEEFDEMYDIID